MFVAFVSTVLLLCSALGVQMVNVSAAAVKNQNSDTDLLSLRESEHDWPLADSRGRRTSALCQSHQQRPAGIRHVTCTRHWCLYRLLHLARFLRKKKNICPKLCLTQKWLRWCCTRGKWKLTFCQPTESVKAESAGGSGPLHVTHGVHVGHMFTTGCLPWKSFHSCVNELKIPLLQPKWLEFGFCSRDSALREVKWQRTHRRGFRSLLSWWWGNGCLWTSPHVWWSWSGPEETWLYVALTAQRNHSSDFSSAVFNAH